MLIPKQVAAISKVAADESTRYAIEHVRVVRISHEECRAEATDGRVAMRVTWNDKEAREHYPKQEDGAEDIPKDGAERLIPKSVWDDAMRSVPVDCRWPSLNNLFVSEHTDGRVAMRVTWNDGDNVLVRTVDLDTGGKTVSYETDDDGTKFPKIEEVLPKYNVGDADDAIEIGVDPKILGDTLLTMAKILGEDSRVRLVVPKDPAKPIFLRSTLATGVVFVSVVACVMPCSLT